jgi:polar amino acid transport system permease protein
VTREFLIVWQHFDRLLDGLANTMLLALLGTVLSLMLGCIAAMPLMARHWAVRSAARWLVDAMRCIPFLLLAYIVYYALPSFGINFDNWTAGLCAIVVYNTAYMAEIVRGAWSRLPPEYSEAGRSFGFYGIALYRRIILPPVMLAAIPMIGNQVIQIIKDTAFLTIIAVPELTHAASSLQSNYYVPFAAFIAAVCLYWVLCRTVEVAVAGVERIAEERR